MSEKSPRVGIIMGSKSDWPVMEAAKKMLDEFGVASEVRVLSAHRTPEAASDYATSARQRGLAAIVAGAGVAAHLAGVVAAQTTLPVIGVPLASGPLVGMDALLATVQMPGGIPVATVGIGRADNAALLALRILAGNDAALEQRLGDHRQAMAERVAAADRRLQEELENLPSGP